MLRTMMCAVALIAAGSFARADELDKEAPGPKAPAAKAVVPTPAAKAVVPTVSGTEMDQESPDAAHHYRGGWGGYHGGYGYRGGYYGGGYGYRGYGYRGWHGGWGYRPYYTGFYRPFYRPYYGTSISIGYPGYGFGYGYNSWYW